MEGVILFADDKVFGSSYENEFFRSLLSEKVYPVLGVDSLELLEKTVRSISTYKALILDWNFNQEDDMPDGIEIPDETPASFLLGNDIYSLIYIYSNKQVEQTEDGKKLITKYGDKIKFKQKNDSKSTAAESAASEKQLILDEILAFEQANPSLIVPFIWSQAINRSTQQIFGELETADPNWIKEIYTNAKDDGGAPIVEVISVFQHLLAESIIQNPALKQKILDVAQSPEIEDPNKMESLAKLYNRLLYTQLTADAPIMTGDIFLLDENTSAVLITPECDVETKKDTALDFLLIKRNAFDEYLKKQHSYQKSGYSTAKEKHVGSVIKSFNQDEAKFHVLPSFPFEPGVFNTTALIEFPVALIQLQKSEFENKRGNYKLNSPYIHQLRQRYLAYIGRVGVPAIPSSLRHFNIKE